MKSINNLLDLLVYNLQTLYLAEELIQKSLPHIIEKVHHNSLKNALQHHLSLTDEQKKRLKNIEESLIKISPDLQTDISPVLEANGNKGVTGLLEEANEILQLPLANEVKDVAIISVVQKIEHYEICGYGNAYAYANQLQLHQAATLLRETLDEEYAVDDLLTALATAAINKEALPEGLEISDGKNSSQGNIEQGSNEGEQNVVSISERNIQSPGGRAGTSHRTYNNGESRGH